MQLLAGRLAALAGIDPENPDRLAPQPGGLLGLFLSASHSNFRVADPQARHGPRFARVRWRAAE